MGKLFSEILNHTILRHYLITVFLFLLALTVFTPSVVRATHEVNPNTLNFVTTVGVNPAAQAFVYTSSNTGGFNDDGTITDSETWIDATCDTADAGCDTTTSFSLDKTVLCKIYLNKTIIFAAAIFILIVGFTQNSYAGAPTVDGLFDDVGDGGFYCYRLAVLNG